MLNIPSEMIERIKKMKPIKKRKSVISIDSFRKTSILRIQCECCICKEDKFIKGLKKNKTMKSFSSLRSYFCMLKLVMGGLVEKLIT